jgi:hypothetical protein
VFDPSDFFPKHLAADRLQFAADPFGYSASAWIRWAFFQQIHGFNADPEKPPTANDLKSPVLWLSHARALSEAASAVLRHEPTYEAHPRPLTGVCDSQYTAIGLMLVGYSLEVCLKAMLIIRQGVQAYADAERRYKHHRLDELAAFIPDLSKKDLAILKLLTHFLTWAGRYPDPGSGREGHSGLIFELSEKHQIAASDVLQLASRVMQRSAIDIDASNPDPPAS